MLEEKLMEAFCWFHQHPELSYEEYETTARIREFLEEAGDDDDNYDGGEDEPQSGNHSAG